MNKDWDALKKELDQIDWKGVARFDNWKTLIRRNGPPSNVDALIRQYPELGKEDRRWLGELLRAAQDDAAWWRREAGGFYHNF
jgi:hypothetical protein